MCGVCQPLSWLPKALPPCATYLNLTSPAFLSPLISSRHWGGGVPQGCKSGHFPFWPLCPLPNCPARCKSVNEAGEGLQGERRWCSVRKDMWYPGLWREGGRWIRLMSSWGADDSFCECVCVSLRHSFLRVTNLNMWASVRTCRTPLAQLGKCLHLLRAAGPLRSSTH